MIHRYIIEATDEVKGFEEAIEQLDREWGIEELEPCNDCISRQEVLDMMQMRMSGKELYKAVYELPPVTLQPKMGRWINQHIIYTNATVDFKVCSECRYEFSYDAETGVSDVNYCPHCGAKMIENEEEFDNLEEMLEKLWNDTESEEKRMNIKLDKGAFEPIREHKTDAGLDLRTPEEFVIKPNDSYIIDTGVHIELPKGYYGKLESKSGLNVKHNIVCLGGTIDEPYRGSIVVKLYNVGKEEYHFNKGDKIVQLVIQPYLAPDIEYTDKLSETDRGDNGFGSTGK